MVSMDFYEMVLDNGLERFACDTNSSSLASQIEKDKLKKGDRVNAILRTQCYPAKTKDGKDFFSNRTKIIDIKAEPSGVAPIF